MARNKTIILLWTSLVMLTLSDSLTANSDSKMTAILDQKHYIEELNRHLSCTVTDLQGKMDSLEKTNSKLIEEVEKLDWLIFMDFIMTLYFA